MEERLALVNSLAILYYDYFQEADSTTHKELVRKAVALIKLPEIVTENDDRAALLGMRHIINDIMNGEFSVDRKQILQRFRINCPFDHNLLKCLGEVMEEVVTKEVATKHVSQLVKQLHLFINRNEIKRLINRASFTINNDDGTVSIRDTISTLRQEMEKFDRPTDGLNGNPLSFVGRVTTDSPDGFEEVFTSMEKQLEGAVLRTGWKAVNRMLGIKGGIAPGEMFVTPALPHNAKTTFSLSLVLSLCLFNRAEDFVEPGKKAMILDITLENELDVNIPIAYKMIYEYYEGVEVDLRKINAKEAAAYISRRLKANGWTYVFERHISSDFSVETLRNLINDYEAQGYQIVVCRPDYLGVTNKTGLSNGAIGSEVREVYRRARNICAAKKIAMISPHQLSPEAKRMKTIDPGRFVRNLPGKGLYDGCTTVDNEVDGEIFLGITDVGDNSYLELQRGKHRTLVDTPVKHRYCVLKFAELGTLPWDVEKDYDLSLASVNADAMNREDDMSFLGY